MNCEQAKPLIQIYADGELEAARVPELEKHLRECASCAVLWSNLRSLQKAVKKEALSFAAPAHLRTQIKADLLAQIPSQPRRSLWDWLLPATVGFATACVAALLIFAGGHRFAQKQLASEIVSSHIRSLMVDHQMDVASSDQHTVKPWFNGKLDFSPPVKDLASDGFPLVGGRLDYVNGRAVAALVYQRQKHVINVFVWPTREGDSMPRVLAPEKGYHLVQWAHGGMNFWAVSDLNEKELGDFARLLGS